MPDATAQLESIKRHIDRLVSDAENPGSEVYLPEVGRVLTARLLLDTVLQETRRRERRQGAVPAGGLDNSVPAGDRA